MKRALLNLLAGFYLLTAAATLSAQEIDGVVFSLDTDNKKWKMGNQANLSGQKIIQYVPEGESISNWTELFSVQIVEIRMDPQNIYNLLLKELRDVGPGTMVENNIISRGEKGLFAEWWINAKSPIDQHEWIRIFNADDYTIILRYTTKKSDKLEDAKKIWVPILENAYFKGRQKTRLVG